MTKIAPEGFYTGEEAAKKLSMGTTTFYRGIKSGRIALEKYVPLGYVEGYYEIARVNELARNKRIEIISNSRNRIEFKRVDAEEELDEIVDLCIPIYGGPNNTPSYQTRLDIWKKNPEVYYVTKKSGVVSGYVSLIWFDDEALKVLMGPSPRQSRVTPAGTGVYSVANHEHVMPFIEGQPIDSLFVSIGVIPGLSKKEKPKHAAQLLRGTQDVLASFADRGMPVGKLLATSDLDDGIALANKLKMKEIPYPGDKLLRYELVIEESDEPLLKAYKMALMRWQSQNS